MKSSEKQELRRKIRRLGIFFLIVLVPAIVVSALLWVAKIEQWLNIMILVLMLFVLYFVYLWICNKLDKRKEERMKKKKDPFSE